MAYSSAELGVEVGSIAGFTLYMFYTFSSLFIAMPVLQLLNAKIGILLGLIGLLVYVLSFFISLLVSIAVEPIFVTGAAVGGIGAGLLWTSQASYYTLNAEIYSKASGQNEITVLNNFAAVFSVFYLSIETAFKLLATLVFFLNKESQSTLSYWRAAVFGIYSVSAFVSVGAFHKFVKPLVSQSPMSVDGTHRLLSDEDVSARSGTNSVSFLSSHTRTIILQQAFSVSALFYNSSILRLLIPYQVCFGLSAGLVDTYVNGVIVKTYIGDGYIGLLSALITLAAVLSAGPFVWISNRWPRRGKCFVMLLGGFCFLWAGLPLLIFEDAFIAKWPFVIFYYLVHGNFFSWSELVRCSSCCIELFQLT